jgi:acyl-coenzyme A synthetase/AMP-(fatty) acid ligase
VTRAEFLADVAALAPRLPHDGYVLNWCMDRYWFAVVLFASISRNLTSLLPNSPAPEHVASLCAETPDLICVGDLRTPPLPHLPYLHLGDGGTATLATTSTTVPRIPFDRRVARVFTSGSTGKPQPHDKTFGNLCRSVEAEAERLWAVTEGPCAVMGTVPIRHMYGLESTVLLPLIGGGLMSAQIPFYPADVAAALAELPAPRLLVTTPFHLRKLLDAEIDIPPLAAVLSATAPLPPELTNRVEDHLGVPMMEIYGSTETGQLASRRTARQADWQTFAGIRLSQDNGVTTASGGHLAQPQVLNDVIELRNATTFRLVDRSVNMVNIVGKRSSLEFLNHLICSLPGVHDGVFCLPERGDGAGTARLAAFVVAPGRSPADILAALRPHLDPVFLPRPIVAVDALPRDGNGKIPAAALQALIAEHVAARG